MVLDPDDIAELAEQLKALRKGRDIVAFRQRLTPEQAAAVIAHPSLSPVEVGAITLALRFADNTTWHRGARGMWGDAEIIDAPDTLSQVTNEFDGGRTAAGHQQRDTGADSQGTA